jgi:uncharacterized spore protein YtfJ
MELLAQKIGLVAMAATLYGDPIERNGTMVVSVAKIAYGFGGEARCQSRDCRGAWWYVDSNE